MFKRTEHRLVVILALALVLFFVYSRGWRGVTAANNPSNLSGYAWSSNIGWISFKGSNYGVTYDQSSGSLAGYAWSSNIGWISFNTESVVGCPGGGSCSPKISGNGLVGWARACAVFASGCSGALRGDSELGGWDGWISLSGSSPTYGVSFDRPNFSGYAWGGGSDPNSPQFPGWISFSGSGYGVTLESQTVAPQVVCSLTPYPTINQSTTWTAEATPPNGATYVWTVTGAPGSYTVGDLNSSSVTIKYLKAVAMTTDVAVTFPDNTTLHCDHSLTTYNVIDKNFSIGHSPSNMTATFAGNIKTIAIPNVTIFATPASGFSSPISLSFVEIRDSSGSAVSGRGQALIANPSFSSPTLTSDASGAYSTSVFSLQLIKNQSADPGTTLQSGNYSVVIRASGGGIESDHPISLTINNPDSGVVEK